MRLGARGGAILSRSVQARAYADGKILNEEERAQETMYIKKMEKEKLEKAKQAAKAETATGDQKESTSSSSIPGPSTDSSKNLAIFAGIAAVLAAGVWTLCKFSRGMDF
ncbi:hypothetical protein GOP47_0004966 [Adiantum capillus-veneris]|uniref:F1F0-ATPase inhibitor protein n=1 Tax=Adiantum capillus-veneris TaxID=13818 RepID=A0A9D4V508_ADICA|nr:hypothetical protein GOP47_0004966 [Adiantum capillus-veneris]